MIPLWADILIALMVVLGALFALIGAIGLVRLDDFLKRLHAPTKASTLGVGCVLIASIVYFTFSARGLSVHELLITLFVFLTAPVSANLLTRAALKDSMRDDGNLPPPPPPPNLAPPAPPG